MFQLKSKQLAAFSAQAAADFPERLVAFLRREVPEACDASTPHRARGAIERAHRFGLHAELDVATFAVLTFACGPAFDEEPWASAVLSQEGTPAGERIHRVYEAAIRRALVEGTAMAGKEQP